MTGTIPSANTEEGFMQSRHVLRGIFAAGLWALPAVTGLAQSSSGGGSVVGTVKDLTGAVVPNAKVQVIHIATGVAHHTVTNADGYFSTATLIIGKYRVHVEAAGMKDLKHEIAVEVESRRT